MSTSPKSTDMRLLAIKYMEEGKTAVFVSKILNIHPNTASLIVFTCKLNILAAIIVVCPS